MVLIFRLRKIPISGMWLRFTRYKYTSQVNNNDYSYEISDNNDKKLACSVVDVVRGQVKFKISNPDSLGKQIYFTLKPRVIQFFQVSSI